MTKELFFRLYSDLAALNPDKDTLVTYENGVITYVQLGVTISLPYLSLYFKPKRKFKYGVLTPGGLFDLRSTLKDIVDSPKFEGYLFAPDTNKTLVYSLVQGLKGPQILHELSYVTLTGIYAWVIMRYKGATNRRLLEVYKSTKKHE